MSRMIDLNADLGEMPGDEGRALDAAILDAVSSCNIACGGHVGDDQSMRATLLLAKDRGTRAGAHPSYPDREGFGRRRLNIDDDQLERSLFDQVAGLLKHAGDIGVNVTHVKPHGALYNDAAKDQTLADIVARVTKAAGIPVLVGPPNSLLQSSAEASGLIFVAEGFADRAYEPDGSLVPRSEPGAVIEDEAKQSAQALLIAAGHVRTRSGKEIALPVQTLCLHGDTKGARETAIKIREALEAAGFQIGQGR